MLSFAGTYPEDQDYWVLGREAAKYPWRYGDVLATPTDLPAVQDGKGKPWHALLALHPSCELGAKAAPKGVQVAHVHLLRSVSVAQRQEVRVGVREVDGRIQVSRANTAYLAPLPDAEPAEELFADLRDVARVDLEALQSAGRLAAMTHDARIALLRRDLYFRHRWMLPLDDLVALEANRIRGDSAFQGPRPPWAQ